MPEWLGEKKGASSPAATKMNKQANQTSHQRKPYADGQVPRCVDLSVCAAFVVLLAIAGNLDEDTYLPRQVVKKPSRSIEG